MSSILSEGVRVPDIGSTSWGADVNYNWGLLNTALANISGNVKVDVANTWTATQTFTETISGSIDGIAARAVGDEDGNNIKTALAGKAADNAVVHLAGAETITGDKTWTGLNTYQKTLTLKDATAISAGEYGVGLDFRDYAGNRYGYLQPHVMSDGTKNLVFGNSASGYLEFAAYLIPYASGVLPLGTNSFRWNGIYDANSIFVYNGYIFGTAPTGNKYWGLWCRDNAGVEVVDLLAVALKSGVNAARIRCLNTDGTNTYDRHIELIVGTDGTTQFIPNASGVFDLGRASAKWKTLNGINPGVLSFPADSYINLDTTSWNLTGVTFTYTPSSDGWLMINVRPSNNFSRVAVEYATMRVASESSSGKTAMVTCPVRANVQCSVAINAASIAQARLISCLGNV